MLAYIVRRFMDNLNRYSLLPIEMFFSKSKLDTRRIHYVVDPEKEMAEAAEMKEVERMQRQMAKEKKVMSGGRGTEITVKSGLGYAASVGALVAWLMSRSPEECDGGELVNWLYRIFITESTKRQSDHDEQYAAYEARVADWQAREDAGENPDLEDRPGLFEVAYQTTGTCLNKSIVRGYNPNL